MKQELMLWRFGAGVLGGWWAGAIVLAAILFGYVIAGYALFNPQSHSNRLDGWFAQGAMLSATAFLCTALGITLVRIGQRAHPLARLAPGAGALTAALMRRLGVIAVVALLPAGVLRALMWQEVPVDVGVTVSLFDITPFAYFSATMYVLHVALLMALAFGSLRVPLRMAFLPIQLGAFSFIRGWSWLPLISCVVLVAGTWLWRRFEAQWSLSPPTRPASATQRPSAIALWWHARHVQRITRAHAAGGTRARVAALLWTQSTSPRTVGSVMVATLYLALKPGYMDSFAVSWLMALPIAALLSMPPAIPLSRIMLLPLGAERARVGEIIAAVWAQQIRTRVLFAVVAGMSLHAFLWWLQWPAFIRSPFFAPADPATHLLWAPLAQAAGLYGMAVSTCLIATASPQPLQRAGFLTVVPWLVLSAFAVLGLAITALLNHVVPATAAREMGHITFAIVNGAMLPACAWCVHRALRHQWSTANLAAVSAAMQKWSARFQKAHSSAYRV